MFSTGLMNLVMSPTQVVLVTDAFICSTNPSRRSKQCSRSTGHLSLAWTNHRFDWFCRRIGLEGAGLAEARSRHGIELRRRNRVDAIMHTMTRVQGTTDRAV
jgi:hypothetical protein